MAWPHSPDWPRRFCRSVRGGGAQRWVGVEHGTRQALVELRVGFGGVQLAQGDLAVGPGQIENAIGEARVLILFEQAQADFAGFADAGNDIDGYRLPGGEGDAVADRDDGIEHGAGAVR